MTKTTRDYDATMILIGEHEDYLRLSDEELAGYGLERSRLESSLRMLRREANELKKSEHFDNMLETAVALGLPLEEEMTMLFETARSLQPNDVILVRSRMKRGDEVFSCRISSPVQEIQDEQGRRVCFTYQPCNRPDSVQCGFGCHFIPERPEPWGWYSIEVVGHQFGWRPLRQPSLYRNPGYDLVNM